MNIVSIMYNVTKYNVSPVNIANLGWLEGLHVVGLWQRCRSRAGADGNKVRTSLVCCAALGQDVGAAAFTC